MNKKTIVKEFAEKLAIKALKLNALECYHICNLIDEVLKEYEEQLDEFADCKTCSAWSGSECTRNPYTEGCLKEETK